MHVEQQLRCQCPKQLWWLPTVPLVQMMTQQPLMTIIIFLEAMKTPKHHWTECKTSLVVAAVKKKK
jgi:hypothetical protein